MPNERDDSGYPDRPDLIDKAPVHIDRRGCLYVDADELVRSRPFWENVREMADLPMGSPARRPTELHR